MPPDHLKVVDRFSRHARALRAVYDDRFRDPLQGSPDRFVWDYWHVPDQYTLLRTPAVRYFPRASLEGFLGELTDWGMRELGCRAVTIPWLSAYVDGCRQELHADNHHGPWAYVLSLSTGAFRGGETLVMKPGVLDYWKGFRGDRGVELPQLVDRVEPRFNRLVAFDPRLPHGVTEVRGSHDPREARLVLHGWFTDPAPFYSGKLTARALEPVLNAGLAALPEFAARHGIADGLLSVRLRVRPDGRVASARRLASTLAGRDAAGFVREVLARARGWKFGRARGPSEITFPVLVKGGPRGGRRASR